MNKRAGIPIMRKGERLQLLKVHVILSKYLISNK